jgi:hypothetical protein
MDLKASLRAELDAVLEDFKLQDIETLVQKGSLQEATIIFLSMRSHEHKLKASALLSNHKNEDYKKISER